MGYKTEERRKLAFMVRMFFAVGTVLFFGLLMVLPVSVKAVETVSRDINQYEPVARSFWGNNEYCLYDISMTWPDAKDYCESIGGHLVTITSKEEQGFVESLLDRGSKKQYWIGMSRTNGRLQWVTEETLDYTNWDAREPDHISRQDGQKEDYIQMLNLRNPNVSNSRRFGWNDIYYDNTFPNEEYFFSLQYIGFICEFESRKQSQSGSNDYIVSDWAKEEIDKADDAKLIPTVLRGEDLRQPINRAEFAAVTVKVYESLTGTKAVPGTTNPFADTSDQEVLKAYGIGTVNGMSATAFEPYTLLNREQCATMLTRVFKRVTIPGWTLNTDSRFRLTFAMPPLFADDAIISDYARESVYFMAANKIINGMGNNIFAPRNTTSVEEARHYANATREQAIAIALRMVENLRY